MKININLYADWIDIILGKVDCLSKQGFRVKTLKKWLAEAQSSSGKDLSEYSEAQLREKYHMDLVFMYLDWSLRLVEPRPRMVHFANDFACPEKHNDGLESLIGKIEQGVSLTPHLSRDLPNMNARDGLLFDWGINHLHLGIMAASKKTWMVEGTKEVVYVCFDLDSAYLLMIADHAHFEDKQLLEIVARDFPHLIDKYEMKDIPPSRSGDEWSGPELRQLRKAGVSSPVTINGKLYMSPGGGFVMSGGALRTNEILQQITYRLTKMEEVVREYLPEIFMKYPCSRLFDISMIALNMKLYSKDEIVLVSVKRDFFVRLLLGDNGLSLQEIGLDAMVPEVITELEGRGVVFEKNCA